MKYLVITLSILALGGCQNPFTPKANPLTHSPSLSTKPVSNAFEQGMDTWLGVSADELVYKNGAPAKVYDLSEGVRGFEYLVIPTVQNGLIKSTSMPRAFRDVATAPGNSPTQSSPYSARRSSNGFGQWGQPPGARNAYGGQMFPSVTLQFATRTPKETKAKACAVVFRVTASDLVQSWSSNCE